MDCGRCREAISARLDREDPGIPAAIVEAHLAGCAACRSFAQQAAALHGSVRVTGAPSVPDRTAVLVSTMVGAQAGWRMDVVRAVLIGLAAVEIFGGAISLLGAANRGLAVHQTRELGGFGIALGFGLLLAALRPARITGVLPVVATLAVTSLVGTALDVTGGRAALSGEVHHLLEIVAVLLLWRLTRPRRFGHTRNRLATS